MPNDACGSALRKPARSSSHRTSFLMCALAVIGFAATILSGNAAAQNVIAQISVPENGSLTVDPFLNTIYLGLSSPSAQPVYAIDGYTFSVTSTGAAGDTIGVNRLNDNWWAPGVYSGAVGVYNGNTYSLITTLSTGYCPLFAGYDRKYNRMWVGDQCGAGNDPVFAFNASTFALQKGPIGTGGVLGGTTINSATGILYVASNGIERVDPVTFAVTTTSLPGFPSVADPDRNLLYGYYSSSGANFLYIAGGGSRTTSETIKHTIPLSFAPTGNVVANTALEHLYIGNASALSINVLDSLTGASVASFPLGSGVTSLSSLAVDSIRGRVYVLVGTSSGWSLYVIEDLLPATKVSPGY